MNIYIDIETIPTQRADIKALIAADITPPGTITKSETLEKWEIEKKPALIEAEWRKTALNGTFGELLCIGWALNNDDPSCVIRTTDEPEAKILEEFFTQLTPAIKHHEGYTPATWIGHYISGFDLRFIWQRAVINGIKPPFYLPYDAKPWSDSVYDTKIEWTGLTSYSGAGSLDKVSQAMGYEGKGNMDGSKVWDAVQAGLYDEIATYCMDDVEKARTLHQRMTFKVSA